MVITDFLKKEVYQKINLKVDLSDWKNNNGKFYFSICAETWLPIQMKIEINGVVYDVLISDDDDFQYMVVGVFSGAENFKLLNFHFFVGTSIDTTKEFESRSNVVEEKTPFVWIPLTNEIREIVKNRRLSAFPFSYKNLCIFFVSKSNYTDFTDEQRLENFVRYLYPYKERFIKAIEINGVFSKKLDYTSLPLSRFANMDRKGYFKNILDSTELSGLELRLNFAIKEKCKCV